MTLTFSTGYSYIYIPLGGAKNVLMNTLLVFSFVALWHDLTFRLLAWGWLISLFVVPELIATYILPPKKVIRPECKPFFCALLTSCFPAYPVRQILVV